MAHHEPMTAPLLVDAYAASTATGAKPGTIHVWLHRGKLTRHGYDHAGRALIDLHELEARTAPQPA